MKKLVMCVLFVGLLSVPVLAQEKSADEIAKELANPNTALTSLKLQSQYYSFDGDLQGADDLDMFKLFLQPTLPFPMDNGYTLWVRPGLPYIIDQPDGYPAFRRAGSRRRLEFWHSTDHDLQPRLGAVDDSRASDGREDIHP
jgi:hypothetical protein